jgi:hypothetical protein
MQAQCMNERNKQRKRRIANPAAQAEGGRQRARNRRPIPHFVEEPDDSPRRARSRRIRQEIESRALTPCTVGEWASSAPRADALAEFVAAEGRGTDGGADGDEGGAGRLDLDVAEVEALVQEVQEELEQHRTGTGMPGDPPAKLTARQLMQEKVAVLRKLLQWRLQDDSGARRPIPPERRLRAAFREEIHWQICAGRTKPQAVAALFARMHPNASGMVDAVRIRDSLRSLGVYASGTEINTFLASSAEREGDGLAMRSGGALDVEEFAQAIDHFVLKCSPPSSPDTPQTPIQPADADDGEQDGMQPEDFERYMRVKAAEVRPLERTLSAPAVAQLMARKCSVSGRGSAIAQNAGRA